MKSHFLGPFLLWLKAQELPVGDWLAARGLDDVAIGALELEVPRETYCELLDIAEAALPQAALGLAFARSAPRMYAFMEALWQNCPNVEAMLGTWAYYSQAMSGRMSFDVKQRDGAVVIDQTCAAYDLKEERVSNEFLIAWFVLQIRRLTCVQVIPAEVMFAHEEPVDVQPYVELFGTRNLRFEAKGNRLVLDVAVKDLPIALADSRVFDALVGHVRKISSAPPPETRIASFIQRLHEEIDLRLAKDAVQIDDIARKLGLSTRTLQRRLSEEQSSFQREVERVRERSAKRYLLDPKVTLTHVAGIVGYRDVTAFFRAFKRWTGETPSEFRARHAHARQDQLSA